jgi:phosphoribosylformimino-5-aminoimidazole carboxamide ribotide isomerase
VREADNVIGWLAHIEAEQLCIALDCQAQADGQFYVHTSGWQERSQLELYALAGKFANAGFVHALITDIARDGMLQGPNVALYQGLARALPGLKVQASGGVAGLADLPQLKDAGADGVVIGKALLEGRFTLQEALLC